MNTTVRYATMLPSELADDHELLLQHLVSWAASDGYEVLGHRDLTVHDSRPDILGTRGPMLTADVTFAVRPSAC